MKTEIEFRAARTMWAVIDIEGLIVAEPGDTRSHKEWLDEKLGNRPEKTYWSRTVRGYVIGERLSAYIGDNFDEPTDHKAVLMALRKFPQVKVVTLGAIKADVQPWPGRSTYTREQYTKLKGTE